MSRTWKKPELIVLYKGRPDENLLGQTYCKGVSGSGKNGPDRAAAGGNCADKYGVECRTYSAS
jgi:hypothetical protein